MAFPADGMKGLTSEFHLPFGCLWGIFKVVYHPLSQRSHGCPSPCEAQNRGGGGGGGGPGWITREMGVAGSVEVHTAISPPALRVWQPPDK